MTKPKPTFDLKAAESRASAVLATLDSVICHKLVELKPKIIALRMDFKRKPKTARIAECLTWAEFCQKKLHRTDRAIQKLLAGKPTPTKPKPKPEPELSSGAEEKKGGAVGDWPTVRRRLEARVYEDLKPFVSEGNFRSELLELFDTIAERFGITITIGAKGTAPVRVAPILPDSDPPDSIPEQVAA